jgi:hypothetical protein
MAGSGDALFTGRWKYDAFGLGCDRLGINLGTRLVRLAQIDRLVPELLHLRDTSGVAPAQAMVDSSLAKLVTPATVGLLTWAHTLPATSMAAKSAAPRECFASSRLPPDPTTY